VVGLQHRFNLTTLIPHCFFLSQKEEEGEAEKGEFDIDDPQKKLFFQVSGPVSRHVIYLVVKC